MAQGNRDAFARGVSRGRYVARRLATAGLRAQAQSLLALAVALRTAGRAWEDANDPVDEAMADRDAADLALDTATQEARFALASRGMHAAKEAPYTDIFPDGIEAYTLATLDEQVPRYRDLVRRVTLHLAPDDAVRVALLPKIEAGLAAWTAACDRLDAARGELRLKRDALDKAADALDRQLQKTRAALTLELDARTASSFFPRTPAKEKTLADA
jgi:hypothetical protein